MAAVGARGTGVRRLPHLGAHRQHPGRPSRASARGNESEGCCENVWKHVFFKHFFPNGLNRNARNRNGQNIIFCIRNQIQYHIETLN